MAMQESEDPNETTTAEQDAKIAAAKILLENGMSPGAVALVIGAELVADVTPSAGWESILGPYRYVKNASNAPDGQPVVERSPIWTALFVKTILPNTISPNPTGWTYVQLGEREATRRAAEQLRHGGHEAFWFALPGQYHESGLPVDTRLR